MTSSRATASHPPVSPLVPARSLQADSAVREVNMALHALLEAAPVAIISVDRRGVVLSWNPAAEAIFGWRADEVVGRLNPLVDGDSASEFHDLLCRTLAGEIIADVDLVRRRKDGSEAPIRLSASRLSSPDGRHFGVVAIITDMTRQKMLQESLLHAQKMEAVGRLAGGIAHDFNNLMTVVLCSSELASEQLPENHAVQSYLRSIDRAAQRASELTSQMLTFARRHVVCPRALDLNDLVLDTEYILRRLIGPEIELAMALSDAPCRVHADPNLIQQVIVNLAVNARDAMETTPTAGRLTVRTGVREVGATPSAHVNLTPGRYVSLAIADTGCGMTAEVQARLFEPFFTTKEVGKGTGLGLATSHGIVEQCGGAILVESQCGAGSTFTVLLPCVADERAEC